jgi:serine/threonine-protein kinase HipA
MSVNGKFEGITRTDMRAVAERYDLLAEFKPVLERVEAALARWPHFAAVAEVTDDQVSKVKSVIADLAALAKN